MIRKPQVGGAVLEQTAYGRVARVGVAWGVGRQFVAEGIRLAAGIILARLLTPYEFGISAAVGFFLRFANKIGSLGLGAALLRVKDVTPQHLSSVFVVNLTLGVIVWAILTISAPALARVFHDEALVQALRVAALAYLLLPFGTGQAAQMNRDFRFGRLAAVEWINASVFFIVSVGMASKGYSYWSLIYGSLAANTAGILAKVYLGGMLPRLQFSRAAFMDVIPFGIGLQARRQLTFLAEYLDSLIVGRFLGLTALGLYDKAFSTIDRTTDRLTAGRNVFFRIFAIVREDPVRLRAAYWKSAAGVSLIGLPAFGVLMVLGPELIPFVYGDQWRASALPFQILCVAGAMRVSGAYASALTQAHGRIWSEIARLCLYIAAVVAGAIVGSEWGIVGVAVGIALANSFMSLLMQALVCRLTNLRWRDVFGAQVPGVCIAAIVMLVMLAAHLAFAGIRPHAADWERLGVKAVAAAIAGLWLFLKPPFRIVREFRDEAMHDLAPRLDRYIPAWAGARMSNEPAEARNGRTCADARPPSRECEGESL